jgi:hypothetical protein
MLNTILCWVGPLAVIVITLVGFAIVNANKPPPDYPPDL